MIPRLLIRIISLVLVPCLLADPSAAQALTRPALCRALPASGQTSVFESQVLVNRALFVHAWGRHQAAALFRSAENAHESVLRLHPAKKLAAVAGLLLIVSAATGYW